MHRKEGSRGCVGEGDVNSTQSSGMNSSKARAAIVDGHEQQRSVPEKREEGGETGRGAHRKMLVSMAWLAVAQRKKPGSR